MSVSLLADTKIPAARQTATLAVHVAAYVTDNDSEAALRTGLNGITNELTIRRGTILHAIRALERETAPQAIVVDLSGVEDALAALENLARVCPPDVTVVVIGDNPDIAFYRQLVNEIGVAEYLPKPLTRDAVERLLTRHLVPDLTYQPVTRGGHVVAICGASGGAGATTIAVSVAIELAEVVKGNVALVDFNLQHGAAALMLGARPGPGLRIALEDPDKADTLLLERSAIRIEQRMHLVAADELLGTGVSISDAGVRQVLSLVRQKFNYVVVDLPMPLRPELHQVLTLARHVVVVLQPDVASIRNAREIRNLATTMAGRDRVITLLNRCDMRGGLPPDIAAKALESGHHVLMPDLGRRMMESLNLGIPAIKRVPDVRKYLAPLIQEIGGVHRKKPVGARLRGIFGK